tara:strand:- start:165 stop:1547 length:1383 start_codon:yes stop_codon:yes gene_type:complete
MAGGFAAKATQKLGQVIGKEFLEKGAGEVGEKIVKGGAGAGADLLPQVTRSGNAAKGLKDIYYPLRGPATDKAARRAIDVGLNTGMIPIEKAEQLGGEISKRSEVELSDLLEDIFIDQRSKGMNDQLTDMLEDYKPAETGVEYQTGHRKRALDRETNTPKIETGLVDAKGNPELIRQEFDSPGARQLWDRHNYVQLDEAMDNPELIDTIITRQEGLIEGSDNLKYWMDEYAKVSELADNDPLFAKRDKTKQLKRIMKNIKTASRDQVFDYASLNLRTQDKQVFKMNRDRLRIQSLLDQTLEAFGEKGQEWHHTFFGNKEGGSIFLQKLSQEPLVALNLMEHIKRLDIPTSGTMGNLTVMSKADHTKVHNLFRELGLEQAGMLDFADYMKAIGDAYLDGTADVNAIFRMIEIYSEEVVPFLKATEDVGTAMRKTGMVQESEKFLGEGDKMRGMTKVKQLNK